jgi:hypothetical protein
MNTKSTVTGGDVMRALVAILVCLATLPAVCQSNSKYQVGTITAAERNRDGEDATPDLPSYDLSIHVDRTIYVVRYKSEFGLNTVEYAAGRDLLVLVGEKTVTYNDMLGHSHELPIISEKPATPPGTSK